MLAEVPLPGWASGHQVVAVGAQTDRPVDDVGLVTDVGGWVTIQAKKGLKLGEAENGPLADALRQLVDIFSLGVPDQRSRLESLRAIDADRDLVLILTDHSAPQTVDRSLAPVTERLRDLPDTVPLSDVPKTKGEKSALRLIRDHLARLWRSSRCEELTDDNFRRLTKVLSVHTLYLSDDGQHRLAAQTILNDLSGNPENAHRVWDELLLEAQRLAEERSFLDRRGLVRRLERRGINLRPIARMRADINRLGELTEVNEQELSTALAIRAPEGQVTLSRTVESSIVSAVGNLAITGVPGVGKTALLYALAEAARTGGVDLVVLRSDNLASTSGQTRIELNTTHDLADIMLDWTGDRSGLILIDGLDQTRAEEGFTWLPMLSHQLKDSRWRIAATVRTFDLKYGQRWKEMFTGDVVVPEAADAELAGTRHIVVGDLTDEELTPLKAASPRLARLLDEADDRLRHLLANPFNLNLAAQLLTDANTDVKTARSRVGLLDQYWKSRNLVGPTNLERLRTLQAVVRQMVTDGRQSANPLGLSTPISYPALEALQRDGVLRHLPGAPGNPTGAVAFAHPVLFDYAVAVLALGDAGRGETLADVLDADPNLAVTVRPAVDYRLAIAWGNDVSRCDFWHLALRLTSRTSGHLLVALAGAQVAASEIESFVDIEELAKASTGTVTDPHGRWGITEASELTFLLAAAVARQSQPRPALAAMAIMTRHLAAEAYAKDSVDLALIATQVPLRAVNQQAAGLGTVGTGEWIGTAVDCMEVALADLGDPRRASLAQVGGRLLAVVAPHDPPATAKVICAVIAPDAMEAWGVRVVRPLVEQLPQIAELSPDLAVEIGAAVWEHEETQDTPTQLTDSAILGLTNSRKQDLDSVRYSVAQSLPQLMRSDPLAATKLLVRIVELPRMYRWDGGRTFPDPPQLRTGDTLEFAGGHRALGSAADAFVRQLKELAEASEPTDLRLASEIVAELREHLRNVEIWQRLVYQAAIAETLALGRALVRVLLSPNLYGYPDIWVPAAHLAARLSSSLEPEDHLRLETAILSIAEVGGGAEGSGGGAELRNHLQQRTQAILNALDASKLSTEARQLLAKNANRPDMLPDLLEAYENPSGSIATWAPDAPAAGSIEDLARKANTAIEQSKSSDEESQTEALNRLADIWADMKTREAHGSDTKNPAPQLIDLRLQVAERLATAAHVAPDTELGAEVYASLLGSLASPTASTEQADPAWDARSMPGWGVTPATSAIQGLIHLLYRPDWCVAHRPEIVNRIAPLLDDPSPVQRYIAAHALPALYPNPKNLIDELERRLAKENDRHVSTWLMHQLAQTSASQPQSVDHTLERLATLPQWGVLAASTAGEQGLEPEINGIPVGLLATLAVHHNTTYASKVVREWLTRPVDNPKRAAWIATCLRSFLNPANLALRPTQARAFELLELSLDQLGAAFHQGTQTPTTDTALRDRTTEAVRVAENIGQQLYFASGAFDQKDSTREAAPRGEESRFATLTFPLLDGLSAVHHPAVTQHIVEIVNHIASAHPRRALLIAANTVASDHGYTREGLGLDATIQLIKHYMADHRGLVLGDRECTTAIRILLEGFVRSGWDKAIQLAEQLGDMFT